MTPWNKRDSRESRNSRAASDLSIKPSETDVEAWLGADSSETNLDFDGLIFAYLEGDLSAAHRQRLEERLHTDAKLRARTELLTPMWKAFANKDRADRVWMILGWKKVEARIELESRGINIPSPYKRRPYRRRVARRPWPALPLDPKDFVEYVAAELTTDAAAELVRHAFDMVERTGKPDPWIREVRRSWDRGAIGYVIAYFLIRNFADSAVTHLRNTHPELKRLGAQLERVERKYEIVEYDYWHLHEGPPEWQALYRAFNVLNDELVMDILVRNGEREIAEAVAAGDELKFWIGKHLIFRDEDD